MELSDLYSQKILDLAGNIADMPRLADADGSARKVSKVCGSLIEVDVKLVDGVITAYGQAVSACALGQTSAAIVAKHIVGTPVAELLAVREQMRAMLEAEGAPPGGRWDELKYLEPVREYRNRHASTLLVFDALADAIAAAEKAQRVESVTATA